ncbi:hypothetical protein LUZ60_011406 [Juncus effusus]|nr:hypothetical protein LUZ60_011406 [Juncus effusus]
MASSIQEPTLRKRFLTINTRKTSVHGTQKEYEMNGDINGLEEGELGQPVSPAGRLFHEPTFNCHIVAVMGCGTPIDLKPFMEGLEATLVRHPRFSSIQVLDESDGTEVLRWVPVKVNIKDHIIIPSLNSTDPTSNDRLVEDYVSSLSVTGLELSKPLWEFHILNLPTTESASTIVLRGHHSLGDGMSLISLLLACTRRSDDPTALPSVSQPPRRSGSIAKSRQGQDGFRALVMWIFSVVSLVWNTLVGMTIFTATSLFFKDTETPLKGQKGVEFNKKRFVHHTLQLDDIKLVKNAIGCTINDVLIGVTSAALSRYLCRKYDEENHGKNIPKKLRVRSALLVNIRKTPGILDLAEMLDRGKKGVTFGNKLGYILLNMPIGSYDDPLDYVRKGSAVAKRKKNSFESILSYMTADLLMKLFGVKVTTYLSHRVLMHTTLSFSNIMGPQEEVCFYGHPIVYIAPSVYGHPHALTVHYQSYNNKVKLVMAVDESVIPDSRQLLDDFVQSLKSITDAASKLS